MSKHKCRIVVLDGFTCNPGDLDWRALESLGNISLYDRTAEADIVARAGQAEIVVTNKVRLSGETLAQLPALKYIGVLATGYNVIDLEAARLQHIIVSNVPDYSSASVAQMVFAHIFNLTQHVGLHARSVAEGKWSNSSDWCYWEKPLVELCGLTLGIVGLGRIGRCTAKIAPAFGMNVVAHGRTLRVDAEEVKRTSLQNLLQASDVVSLHCPLTADTHHIINAESLRLMKPSAFLINTSRGGLICEHDLAAALNSGQVAGAGLDVLSVEPPTADNPLLTAKNCFITPHIAWATRAARARLLDVVVANIRAFLAGNPQNVVS